MKKILLLFASLLFISCSINITDWHKDGLNKKVRVIQDRTFLAELNEEGKIIKGKEIGGLFVGNQKKYYNKKGLVTEKIIYQDNNIGIDTHKKFEYDKKGICIKRIKLDSNGDIWSEHIFKYKKKPNRIEGTWIDVKDKIVLQKDTLLYDKRGNLIKNGVLSYRYDENNNLIESILVYHGTDHKSITSYSYDSRNIPTKMVQNTSNREMTREFAYKLDRNNNWIEKIEYQEGVPKFITERSIQYY